MTSKKRTKANRRNALASTGPRTAEGKAVSARNATRHGILSRLEVLPMVERPEDWNAHLDAVLDDLHPVGYLETALAERVALQLWRLGRVVRYEREVAALSIESVNADAADRMYDRADAVADAEGAFQMAQAARDIVAGQDVPPNETPLDADTAAALLDAVATTFGVNLYGTDADVSLPDYPDGVDLNALDWTTGHLRCCLAAVADHAKGKLESALAEFLPACEQRLAEARAKRDAVNRKADRLRRERLLPKPVELDKVIRYEVHLERSLLRTLHELQRLQATRAGGAVPAVALDVTIDGEAAA